MKTELTEPRDYFRLYGVPHEAAFPEAIIATARHVWCRRGRGAAGAYAPQDVKAAGRVLAAMAMPKPDRLEVADVATVLLAVGARSRSGVRVPWRVRWSTDKLARWICAVRRIDPATGLREARDVGH